MATIGTINIVNCIGRQKRGDHMLFRVAHILEMAIVLQSREILFQQRMTDMLIFRNFQIANFASVRRAICAPCPISRMMGPRCDTATHAVFTMFNSLTV